MATRHKNALLIDMGAVNPEGIARAFVEGCEEVRASPNFTGTDSLRKDEALRLIVNQLSFMMGNGEMSFEDHSICTSRCKIELGRDAKLSGRPAVDNDLTFRGDGK